MTTSAPAVNSQIAELSVMFAWIVVTCAGGARTLSPGAPTKVRTFAPRVDNRSTTTDPMKPPPPVTRIVFSSSVCDISPVLANYQEQRLRPYSRRNGPYPITQKHH